MNDKFQNKYRISSARLQNWDYGWNASYFVTICTRNRQNFFGEIVNGKMHYSEIGKIAQRFWREIPDHFPFVILDAFVVMPNHVHGIIIINKINDGRNVETQNYASLQSQPKNKFGPQSQNLASIIRGYKTGAKKYATMNFIDFSWQPRFNDHIIRNNHSFDKIRNYINTNIKNWKTDEFHD